MSSAFLAYAYFHLNRIVCGHFDRSLPDTYDFSLLIYRHFHRRIYYAIQQAKLVSRMTKLAFLFLLLSTVAIILAINGPKERFIVFGAIPVPPVFLSALLFIFSKGFEHLHTKKV